MSHENAMVYGFLSSLPKAIPQSINLVVNQAAPLAPVAPACGVHRRFNIVSSLTNAINGNLKHEK